MRIEIDFTDDELIKIIEAGCPEVEFLFANGCEIPEAYPPFAPESTPERFVFNCLAAENSNWDLTASYQQAKASLFDLMPFACAPTPVWESWPRVSEPMELPELVAADGARNMRAAA